MTAQGVRDLNHTGPKEKSAPVDPAPVSVPDPDATVPIVLASAPATDEASGEAALPHG